MTPEDLIQISNLFSEPDPSVVANKLNSLQRHDRKLLAESLFDLQKRIYNTILESSISTTYRRIHDDMVSLFFDQIYRINQNFRSDPQKWQKELDRLRQIDLFADTSDFDLLSYAEYIKEVDLKANVAFMVEYEEVKGVFLLKDSANVYEFNSKLPVIARNGIFGDDACATGTKESSITVKPISDCKALFIPRERFVNLIKSVPGLQLRIFQTVVERAKQGSIRAEEQRRLTQEILDNIGQGSFSINIAGEIGENYTSIAAEYLGTEHLAGVPFADLAFRNDREKLRNYYRALHMLFSGSDFNHNVVIDLLPNEVNINNRDFKLYYTFVQDGAGHVMSLFVRMEDISLQRELARKEAQERAVTSKMQANVGGFIDMLEDLNQLQESMDRFANHFLTNKIQPENQVTSELLRMLHGAKGLSGQYELEQLQQTIHRFEDWFLSVEKAGIATLEASFVELQTAFDKELDYANSFKENLGEGINTILNGVSFEQEQFKKLEQAAKTGDLAVVRDIVFSVHLVPAKMITSNWEKDGLRLAQRLGKEVEIKIDIEADLTVPKNLAKTLNVNLGHLYRNSVDHAIELPAKRSEIGKPPTGLISITVEQWQNDLILKITDDGKGIDWQQMAELAVKNARLDQVQVQQILDHKELWKLLFLPGFSSAGKITEISGRGVGMDAVQKTVENLKGTIEVQSELGSGTEITIRLPIRPA